MSNCTGLRVSWLQRPHVADCELIDPGLDGDKLRRWISTHATDGIIVEHGEAIVGYTVYHKDGMPKNKRLVVDMLYVNPLFRNKGVGRYILEHLKGMLKPTMPAIKVVVGFDLIVCRFFQACGFFGWPEGDDEVSFTYSLEEPCSKDSNQETLSPSARAGQP